MESCQRPRVKVCCIGSVEEAWLAVRYGAHAVGLVSAMPSGPGVIDEELIRKIASSMPPGIATFLLTSRQDVKSIVEQQKYCRTNTIQICDRLTDGSYADLRDALPGISLVQVIHVSGEESIEEAFRISGQVDAVLLDSGNPCLNIKELGGTGRTHDWELSRKIREKLEVPVFLAGGLNPGNIDQAIEAVRPFGLDVCSGLRTEVRLDEGKLALFMDRVFGRYY